MGKAEIITEKLETIGVKYFGLTMPIRQAILSAMEEYADDKNKPLARVLITRNCRETHGVEGAFDEACKRLKESYLLFAPQPINNVAIGKNRTWAIELNTSKE